MRGLIILCYHRITTGEESGRFYTSGLGAAQFHDQMTYIRKYYKPLPLDTALDRLEAGDLPERSISITFDDGYAELATGAFPILREIGIPATVFLITGHVDAGGAFWWEEVGSRLNSVDEETVRSIVRACGLEIRVERGRLLGHLIDGLKHVPLTVRERFLLTLRQATGRLDGDRMSLTWDEVLEAKSGGVSFGSHSVSHPNLTMLDQDALERELRGSKEAIEAMTGLECRVLVYPNGDYDQRVRAAVRKAGYRWALTMERGINGTHGDPFALLRYPVYAHYNGYFFAAMLRGWIDFPFAVVSRMRQRRAG